jgi:hypothetical protein
MGHHLHTIPAGFDPLRQRLRGECTARFRVATTGISDGVYRSPPMENSVIDDGTKNDWKGYLLEAMRPSLPFSSENFPSLLF